MPAARSTRPRLPQRRDARSRLGLPLAAALCLCLLAVLVARGSAAPGAQAATPSDVARAGSSVGHAAPRGITVRAYPIAGAWDWEPLEFSESATDGSRDLGWLDAGDQGLELSNDPGSFVTHTDSAPPTIRSAGNGAPAWKVIGRSVRGRPIVAARFGTGTRHVLVIGGVHGNEAGTAVAAKFAASLARHPAAVPVGARIDVIRCLNPDGAALGARGNARKVDLNRNLPTRNWRSRLRRSDPSSSLGLRGGARPGSEPETRALLAYLKQGFAVVISLHSHAGILDGAGPGGRTLARRMSRLCGLPAGHLSYQAAITGSLGDYVPEKYGIPIITVELSDAPLGSGLRAALLISARPAATSTR
jgi:protein MpaA